MAKIDIKSLPLHHLLSAPLTAAIEAQQEASLGVVSFVSDVGFTTGDHERPAVRFVEFDFVREGLDEEGNQAKFPTKLRIPLLSMLSLPRLEIESMNVNFLAGVQSVAVAEFSPSLDIPRHLVDRYPFLKGHSRLHVTPSSRSTVKGVAQTSRPYDLEISMVVSSDEPTDGVERILTTLTGMMVEDAR